MQDDPFPKYSYTHLICGKHFTPMFASHNCLRVLMYAFECSVCVRASVCVCVYVCVCVCMNVDVQNPRVN